MFNRTFLLVMFALVSFVVLLVLMQGLPPIEFFPTDTYKDNKQVNPSHISICSPVAPRVLRLRGLLNKEDIVMLLEIAELRKEGSVAWLDLRDHAMMPALLQRLHTIPLLDNRNITLLTRPPQKMWVGYANEVIPGRTLVRDDVTDSLPPYDVPWRRYALVVLPLQEGGRGGDTSFQSGWETVKCHERNVTVGDAMVMFSYTADGAPDTAARYRIGGTGLVALYRLVVPR